MAAPEAVGGHQRVQIEPVDLAGREQLALAASGSGSWRGPRRGRCSSGCRRCRRAPRRAASPTDRCRAGRPRCRSRPRSGRRPRDPLRAARSRSVSTPGIALSARKSRPPASPSCGSRTGWAASETKATRDGCDPAGPRQRAGPAGRRIAAEVQRPALGRRRPLPRPRASRSAPIAYRRTGARPIDAVGRVLQPAIHPVEHQRVVVERRRRTHLAGADAGRRQIVAVRPRPDDHLRARVARRGRRATRTSPAKFAVAPGGPVHLVVPAADVEHRRRHAVVLAGQLRPVPPRVVGRMAHPVVVPVGHALERRHRRERTARPGRPRPRPSTPRAPRLVGLRTRSVPARRAQIGRDVEPRPGQPRPVPDPARVPEVHRRGEGHRRHHRHQVRRRLDGGQPLDRARDTTGRSVPTRPFDHGCAAAHSMVSKPSRPFLLVGAEDAAGGVAAAHVLHDDGVAASDCLADERAVGWCRPCRMGVR